jgi:hypothetical protein
MTPRVLLVSCALAASIPATHAAIIIQPTGVTATVAANAGSTTAGLINGSGLSNALLLETGDTYDVTAASVTHGNGPTSGLVTNYVTNDPGAGGGDYFADFTGTTALTFALGGSFDGVDSILVWNYTQPSGGGTAPPRNALRTFNLEFFSDAGATISLGSITGLTLNQSNGVTNGQEPQQQLTFTGGSTFDGVQAIRMTLTDNFFGLGSGAGGDRVGLAEVRFTQVPEPTATLLGGLGLLAFLRRRR